MADNIIEEYCCPPLVAYPIDNCHQLVYAPLTGLTAWLPPEAVAILGLCRRFASLEGHTVAAHAHLPWLNPGLPEQVFDAAIRNGLLLSRTSLLQLIRKSANRGNNSNRGPQETRITTVGFITRARPKLLLRCLESYGPVCASRGRTSSVVIADDTRDETTAEACRSLLPDLRRKFAFDIRYVGYRERRRSCSLLSKLGCASPEVLEFALLGDPSLGITTGANRNALLLQTIGELVLSVDDDTEHQVALIPGGVQGTIEVGYHEAPVETRYFPSRPEALRSVNLGNYDLLMFHEALLGKRLADALSSYVDSQVRLAPACAHLIRCLYSDKGTVTITFNGVIGDPGTYASGWPMDDRSSGREGVLQSCQSYAAAVSSREVVRGVRNPVICHGGPFVGYTMGLDNRVMLPPFCPVLRNQDGIFGAALLTCNSEAFFGHLPVAVLHAPPEQRSQARSKGLAILRTRCSDLLPALICSSEVRHRSFESSLRALGTELEEIGHLDHQEFAGVATALLLRRLTTFYKSLQESLSEVTLPAPYWRRDAEEALELVHASILRREYVTLVDMQVTEASQDGLGRAQEILKRYGAVLRAWPDIIVAARELRLRGDEGFSELP